MRACACTYTRTTSVQPPVDRSTARGDDDLRIRFIHMITITPLCLAEMYSLRFETEWYLDNGANGESPREEICKKLSRARTCVTFVSPGNRNALRWFPTWKKPHIIVSTAHLHENCWFPWPSRSIYSCSLLRDALVRTLTWSALHRVASALLRSDAVLYSREPVTPCLSALVKRSRQNLLIIGFDCRIRRCRKRSWNDSRSHEICMSLSTSESLALLRASYLYFFPLLGSFFLILQ